jgi:hypothetical protein
MAIRMLVHATTITTTNYEMMKMMNISRFNYSCLVLS